MANIIFRQSVTPDIPTSTVAKGTPLTNLELDGNFRSLNDNKVDISVSYSNPSWINSISEIKVLPSQTNKSGYVLSTNGTNSSWTTIEDLGVTDLSITMAIALG